MIGRSSTRYSGRYGGAASPSAAVGGNPQRSSVPARQQSLHFGEREVALDCRHIFVGHVDLTLRPGGEQLRRQRLSGRGSTFRSVGTRAGGGIRGGFEQIADGGGGRLLLRHRFFAESVYEGAVHPRQHGLELVQRLHDLELQKRGTLDHFLRPVYILHAGQFHDDAIVADLLDHGLRDPELVDAGADDLQCLLGQSRPVLIRQGSGRIVDFQREVRPTSQVQT